MLLRKYVTGIFLAVLIISGVGKTALLQTPGGDTVKVDLAEAAELNVRGVLILEIVERTSDAAVGFSGKFAYETARGIIIYNRHESQAFTGLIYDDNVKPNFYVTGYLYCDFEEGVCGFFDNTPVGEGAWPFALSRDRKKAFFMVEPEDRYRTNEAPIIAEYDVAERVSRHLPLYLTPVSDIFYAGNDGILLFSFVNEKVSEEKDCRIENIAKVDVKTGKFVTVTPPDEDRYLYGIAENARLLLAGEDSRDIWGAENLVLCNYDGDVVGVVLESTTLLRWPYARRLSPDGKRFLFSECGKFLGTLCAGETDKPDLFVLENGELKNLTQDKLLWENYDMSPDGLMVGVVVPDVDADGDYIGQYFGVIDIDTLDLYKIIELPENASVDIISWNK
jgi:hypothetical protein